MIALQLPDLEMVRPLGEGSMGRVFLARDPALRRLVAVKLLREELAASDVARRRFEREAQSAARISHPNVTAIYRTAKLPNDVPFIVMEYIDGRTLADLLAARGAFDVTETRRIIVSVASALAAAHRKGIVHRHVQASNVMVENETARIVLMDFGIAALLQTGAEQDPKLTMSGERLGDTLRMSPEQKRGEPVTQQSDVYCLGILARELLTGAVPDANPETPSAASQDAELDDIVRRSLAPNPNHRPLAKEIARVLGGRSSTGAANGVAVDPLDDFVRQLKQRKVPRVALGYMFCAFVGLQVAQLILPAMPVDNSQVWYKGTVALVIAGFPIAVMVSWFFDWTPSGIRRARTAELTGVRRALPFLAFIMSTLIAIGVWALLM